MRTTKQVLAALLAFLLTGCGAGIIYTHTVQPLTLDMHQTPMSTVKNAGDIKHISFSVLSVAWNSNAIGDIAKTHGMEEVYFADIEVLRVLRVWNQYTVHVYGK